MIWIISLLLGIDFALAVAMTWLASVVVRRRRREHLLWIVPFAVSFYLQAFEPPVTYMLQSVAWARPALMFIDYILRGASYCEALAVLALVAVIWKSMSVIPMDKTSF